MSLVELLVAMGIFVVVIAVFMSGVVSMTRVTARAQGVSDATTSARKVLDRFDKQARYSTAVNSPGFGDSGVTGPYYVEYVAPAQDAGATPFCAQWRYDPTGHTMSIRTWTDSATPSPSAWNIIATNVRNAATNPPFVFSFASPSLQRQQLTVTLDIGPAARAGAQVSTTYVARNTSVNTQSNLDANADLVSDSPVCRSGVGRP
jgi:type II secretory pathway pseudopilin PulG